VVNGIHAVVFLTLAVGFGGLAISGAFSVHFHLPQDCSRSILCLSPSPDAEYNSFL